MGRGESVDVGVERIGKMVPRGVMLGLERGFADGVILREDWGWGGGCSRGRVYF